MSIYLEITRKFNAKRNRAIITSGQAVVLHRLAIMSKDGDWILREDEEDLSFILKVLSDYGAKYRLGAPLSVRWLSGGWSSHFEFMLDRRRIRTDFFTRPPRIDFSRINSLWENLQDPPFVSKVDLAETKKTMRAKDYAVISELARIMDSPEEEILYSRSARDLILLSQNYPEEFAEISIKRPVLESVNLSLNDFEMALYQEQLSMIRNDEERLARYSEAAEKFRKVWPEVERETDNLSLLEAHPIVVDYSERYLPKVVNV